MQIPFSSVYIVFANYEKIRIYFLYTLLEIYGKKRYYILVYIHI